jgi:hypothetical protein
MGMTNHLPNPDRVLGENFPTIIRSIKYVMGMNAPPSSEKATLFLVL